jgi:ABC-type glutathione transport system ATPase component
VSDTILEAAGVTHRYRGSDVPAVADIDLAIGPGASVGIVGESGSGKTTLGRLLVGVLRPTVGSVLISGRPWSAVGRRDAERRAVQMVFQDPYAALNPALTAVDTVAEVLRVWDNATREQARSQATALLREVGLPEDAIHRRPRRLSGGQAQRVVIARALACEPRVLIADEPTSALDVSVQAQILNLLLDLRGARDFALVLISHDLGVVRYATDEALVMHEGLVVERGATEQLLDRPEHPYTQLLVASIPGREDLNETPADDSA